MSKRIVILLFASILGAAAIYGLFVYPSQRAQDTLNAHLANLALVTASKHGPVSYDATNGEFKVEKLQLTLSTPKGGSMEIGLLEAEGILTEADSLTAVDALALRNIRILTPTGAHQIDQIVATDVKIDTGVLGPEQNITIADIAQSLLSRSVEVSRVKLLIDKNAAQISLNKVLLTGYQKGILDAFQIEGLQAREPKATSYFSLKSLIMEHLDARPALRDLSENNRVSADQLWAQSISLNSLIFQDDNRGPIAAIDEFQIQRGEFVGGWPQTANFALRNLQINADAATGAVDRSMLQALGYETILLSTSLTQEWDPDAGNLRLTDGALTLTSGGTLSYDFKFDGVDPGFFANGPMRANVSGLKLETAAIAYQDNGLFERIVASSAVRSGQSPEQAKTQLLTNIQTALSSSPLAIIADDLSQAMTKLINGGGKIVLTARPTTDIVLGEILQTLLSKDSGSVLPLNLAVSHSKP